jgi:hypothetical protein
MAPSQARDSPRDPLEERVAKFLYVVGSFCASSLMVLIFAAAFWEIGSAIIVFFRSVSTQDPGLPPESPAIIIALKGIEYLFLAPMSFVVYRSLANYVVNKVAGHSEGEAEVTESKRMVTSLMFAVVATDLMGKALSPEGLSAKAPGYELALLAILGVYIFLLHHMTKSGDK